MAFLLWCTVPVLVMALMLWCLYAHILRLLRKHTQLKYKRGAALGLGVLIMLPACNLWSSFYLLLLLLHFCVFALLWDAVDALVRRFRRGSGGVWPALHEWMVPPLLCTAATAWYGYVNIQDLRETHYAVATAKPIRPEGYRIGLVADVHYGVLDNREAVQAMADALSSRNLDVLIICGDLTDEHTSLEGVQEVCRILGGVKTTYGVYYVPGNHDAARYSSHPPFTQQDLEEALQANGIVILADAVAPLNSELQLAGRRDRSYPRLSVPDLLQGADPACCLVMADHQPYGLEEKAAAGVDLQLSGHTHSGQIFPFGYICSALHIGDLNYGCARFGGMWAVTTSGVTGWGAPMRTQNHSEYVIITLTHEPPKSGS